MYKEEKIFIESEFGFKIPAIYGFNDEIDIKKTIILLHGISTNKDEFLDFYGTLSLELSRHNYSVVRFDFRGHGESSLSPLDFTISSQVQDLITVIKWLGKMKNIHKFSLLGSSFGAPPCIFLSSLFDHLIDKVFLVSPVLSYYDSFIKPNTEWGIELFDNILQKTIFNNEYVYMTDTFYLHSKLVIEMYCTNIEELVKASKKTFYTMHGDSDSMIDYAITKRISKKSKNIRLYTFKDMEHGFTHDEDDLGISAKTKANIRKMIKIIKEA